MNFFGLQGFRLIHRGGAEGAEKIELEYQREQSLCERRVSLVNTRSQSKWKNLNFVTLTCRSGFCKEGSYVRVRSSRTRTLITFSNNQISVSICT